MKTMADTLRTLGAPITDECLVLNLLRGLSPRFDRVTPILTRMKPFPTFAETKNDLLLEELRLSATATAAPATTLLRLHPLPPEGGSSSPHFGPPPPGALRQPTGSGGGGRCRGRKSGRSGTTGDRGMTGGSQWPSVYNPWTGTIHMWPGPSAGASAPRPATPQ
jgi:hypothetical protein